MALEHFGNKIELKDYLGKKVINVLLLVTYVAPLLLQSQDNRIELYGAEKIYLQLSSEIYALDEPIWFKAIVTDAKNNKLTTKSRVLHVELINKNEERVLHQKIKLENGIGHGALDLTSDFEEGHYLVRAYTRWNKNFGDRFIFKEYIEIVPYADWSKIKPIENIAYNSTGNGQAVLTGTVKEKLLPDQKEIQLYLEGKDTKDTVLVNKTKGVFSLNHKISDEIDWLNISLNENNNLKYNQTILLKKTTPDLQFLPESGKIIHGFQNTLGFKAIGQDGKGISVKGSIFNEQGKKIKDFETNHLGMGTTNIKADSTQSYYAKLQSYKNKTYPLPKVYSEGSILSISKIKKKVLIKVASNKAKSDYVYINISSRGRDYFLVEGPLQNGYLTKALPAENLPQGILKFTLLNKERRPVGERLFFNETGKNKLKIEIETDQENYIAREKTSLNINIPDSTGPSLSVMAINKKFWHQGKGETIQSYFLLSSEIRGDIEEPAYYFQEDSLYHFEDLDALLLTQGWRNYKYPATIPTDSLFLPEKGIELNGNLHLPYKEKSLPKNVSINLATFGRGPSFYSGKTDNVGRFSFLLEDEHGTLPVFLNTHNKSKHKIDYQILIEQAKSPNISFEVFPNYTESEVDNQTVREIQQQRKNNRNSFSVDGMNQLDEVLLSGKGATSEELARHKKYGEPDVVIRGDEIRAKEKKWSYGLYSILLFNYGDQIEIERFPDGFMLAHIRAGRGEPTLLLVDGQLLKKHQYDLVPHMDPGVVERVELIKYAKFFKSRYLEVFPGADPLKSPSLGHIISISTKGGGGIYAQGNPAPGTLRTSINTFSPEKEFYAPKYKASLAPGEKKTDFRTLVHWAPEVEVGKNGKASLQFFNPDIPGDYIIIVEGISENGRIGYKQKSYSIVE